MKIVKHRLFWVWQHEKEENWLNEMAQNGLKLTSVGFGRYVFEECEKGKYQFRLELLEKDVASYSSQNYVDFLRETGVECVGNYGNWMYFYKNAEDGPFEIFSDIDSRIAHYKRMLRMVVIIFLPVFCMSFSVWHSDVGGISNFIMRALYAVLLFLGVSGAVRLFVRIKKLQKERVFRE